MQHAKVPFLGGVSGVKAVLPPAEKVPIAEGVITALLLVGTL